VPVGLSATPACVTARVQRADAIRAAVGTMHTHLKTKQPLAFEKRRTGGYAGGECKHSGNTWASRQMHMHAHGCTKKVLGPALPHGSELTTAQCLTQGRQRKACPSSSIELSLLSSSYRCSRRCSCDDKHGKRFLLCLHSGSAQPPKH
jgi:hypothetical protein